MARHNRPPVRISTQRRLNVATVGVEDSITGERRRAVDHTISRLALSNASRGPLRLSRAILVQTGLRLLDPEESPRSVLRWLTNEVGRRVPSRTFYRWHKKFKSEYDAVMLGVTMGSEGTNRSTPASQ